MVPMGVAAELRKTETVRAWWARLNPALLGALGALLISFLGGCSSDDSGALGGSCVTDDQCNPGLICGQSECSGGLQCIPAECECTQNFVSINGQGQYYSVSPGDACVFGSDSECSCAHATCQNPLSTCANTVCPALCQIGESCTDNIACPLGAVCLGATDAIGETIGEGVCRPVMCADQVLLPPLCGSADAPCGEQCCEPDCAGKQCGDDDHCGVSCGTCDPNYICSFDQQCVVDPAVSACSGNLRVSGTTVDIQQLDEELPAAAGGTIDDGIYDLVTIREYRGASAPTKVRAALRFFEPRRLEQIIQVIPDHTEFSPHLLDNATRNGALLQLDETCPYQTTSELGFTVDGSQLLLFRDNSVEVYELRSAS